MRRRLVIALTLIPAVLVAYVVALAVPRPAPPVVSGGARIFTATIDSAQMNEATTPILGSGRQYRIEVTGTWNTGTSLADAAFEQVGSVWKKTSQRRGIVIGNYYMGQEGNEPNNPNTAPGHLYALSYMGSGAAETVRLIDPSGAGGNNGVLTVQIFEQVANYQVSVGPRVEPSQLGVPNPIILTVPTVTIPAPPVGPFTIPSVTVPGLVSPGASVQLVRNTSNNTICLRVSTTLTQPTDLACAFSGGLIPDSPVVGVPPMTVIPPTQTPPQTIGGPGGNVTVGGQTISQSVPSGTSAILTATWKANRSHLYYSPFNTGQGDRLVLPYDPFNLNEASWFAANADEVGLVVRLKLTNPDGAQIIDADIIKVPGLGQYLEAMFESQVRGF